MNARSKRNFRLIESTHLLEIDFDMHSLDSVVQNCLTSYSHLLIHSILRMRKCFARNDSVGPSCPELRLFSSSQYPVSTVLIAYP
jgi:hypothetical protein